MKIIASEWFSNMDGIFGVVVGEDAVTKERKAYLGKGDGISEEEDIQKILEHGAKVNLFSLERLTKIMKKEE